MRREDLIIPYQQPAPKESLGDIGGTLSNTMPMAAMLTRNKYIGWASIVFAIQNWLSESPDSKSALSQPGYMGIGMALMALIITYLPIFLPTPGARIPAPSS